jgi:cysteine desulfurase
MERWIYLDFNASTSLAAEVVEAMRPFLTEHYGNPSSQHWAGAPAKVAVERARAQVAALLGCATDEIVFTSGGTESNNHALQGVFFANRDRGEHIVTSAVEHPAIRKPLQFLETLGAKVTVIPVDRRGRVDPNAVRRALTPRTILVTVMHANNEVGTVQPIAEIAAIARAGGVLVHTDAAQSVGKISTRVDDLGVDLLSIAGHKLYAPKGVGALYVRRGTRIAPLIYGAEHEAGRRAGTESVLLDVGLGAACEVAAKWIGMPAIRTLRDRFERELEGAFGDTVSVNGEGADRLPNTASVNFAGHAGAEILAQLSGVAASTGSACHAGSIELSPVLAAMGVPPREGMGAIRFSLGRTSTWEELSRVLSMLRTALPRVREQGRWSHWERVHTEKGAEQVSWHQSDPQVSLEMLARTGVDRAARIIDVGGGASRLVDALLDKGFRRIAVLDIAGVALEYAKQRLGPRGAMVSWVIADITAWTPSETYDVWHDRATFHFLVRAEDRDAYRNVLLAALRRGGHAIIGTFASDGPGQCSGLPVARYEPATLAAELGPRFRLVEAVREQHVTPANTVQAFQFSRFVRIG